MGLPERAGTAADKREEESLEERCRFVERLLQSIVQMDVEFLCLVDVFPNAVEDDRFQESLCDVRFG